MPIPESPALVRRTLLREDVHTRLTEAIVEGTLAPGEQLRDGDLAHWLGVSRTPVREALLKLSEAGLVRAEPGRSTVVADLDPALVRDAHAVVAAMHRLAVHAAVARLTARDRERMTEANERFADALSRGDAEAALRADDDFHAVPVEVAANTAITAVLAQFGPVVRRLERLRFSSHAARSSIALHEQTVRLCAAGDAEGAAASELTTWQTLEPVLQSLTNPS